MVFSFYEIILYLVIASLSMLFVLNLRYLQARSDDLFLIKEIDEYLYYVKDFHNIYGFYPGDFPFSYRFWNEIGYDGNGDGLVADNSETFHVWRHIEYAKLIFSILNFKILSRLQYQKICLLVFIAKNVAINF